MWGEQPNIVVRCPPLLWRDSRVSGTERGIWLTVGRCALSRQPDGSELRSGWRLVAVCRFFSVKCKPSNHFAWLTREEDTSRSDAATITGVWWSCARRDTTPATVMTMPDYSSEIFQDYRGAEHVLGIRRWPSKRGLFSFFVLCP